MQGNTKGMQWSIPHSVSQAREDVDKVKSLLIYKVVLYLSVPLCHKPVNFIYSWVSLYVLVTTYLLVDLFHFSFRNKVFRQNSSVAISV